MEPVVIKPYEPIDWKDHAVERPRTYRPIYNEDDTILLVPEEGMVWQQGTPLSAANLNHMDQGIINNDARLPVVEICTIDLSGITSELYPRLTLLAGGYGYGIGGYGETPAGGTGMSTIDAAFTFDEGAVRVIVPRWYSAYTQATKIGERTFSLTTENPDDETSLTLVVH